MNINYLLLLFLLIYDVVIIQLLTVKMTIMILFELNIKINKFKGKND